ncbi:MAG: hypothetical protein COT14_03205 [Candidatus Diapherotrites archaeon CG08_land_8_20_14_0_20_30_16]|nr:MAG: hypothetical protein COT14_03205 [Candidatus Diapherotrites archaeon CG08_land_8_20_14_0_20_30_16]
MPKQPRLTTSHKDTLDAFRAKKVSLDYLTDVCRNPKSPTQEEWDRTHFLTKHTGLYAQIVNLELKTRALDSAKIKSERRSQYLKARVKLVALRGRAINEFMRFVNAEILTISKSETLEDGRYRKDVELGTSIYNLLTLGLFDLAKSLLSKIIDKREKEKYNAIINRFETEKQIG